MVFMFRFIVFSSIACVGSGSMFRVYWLLLNILLYNILYYIYIYIIYNIYNIYYI